MLATGDAVAGYRIERELGSGGMASVFKVERVEDGKIYAMKEIRRREDTYWERIARSEVQALKACQGHVSSPFPPNRTNWSASERASEPFRLIMVG